MFAEQQADAGGKRLTDLVYPQPAFDKAAKAEQEAALRSTRIAQPAIGAVSLAACAVLRSFGVEPEAVAGHSYGELVALCAAGRIDGRALHVMSNVRGQLMNRETKIAAPCWPFARRTMTS